LGQVYPHIIEDIEQWPIYELHKNRAVLVEEMNAYSFEKLIQSHGKNLEELLAKTIYLERIRVKNNPWKVDPGNESAYWKKLESEIKRNSQSEEGETLNRELLLKIINRYSEEIVGNFKPSTFKFARKFLTSFFRRLLNSAAGRNHRRLWGSRYQMHERLLVSGHVDELRTLMKKGTVVVLPTHSSNIDSILIGYAFDEIIGVPAFNYGAGLNLYNNELIAYFMNRLGAYKVDRRKKNPIYLENLKTFSSLALQKGVNTIFFPGGTRSRSGILESNLKLGLMSTLIEAQRKQHTQGKKNKIFVIPLIVSYHFVLEAKFLIESHLKAQGKEKYFKTSGKETTLRSMISFLWNLFSQGSDITLSFGSPMDVFGNKVDTEGESFDEFGKSIQIEDYFNLNGHIGEDIQRESIYTKRLGEKIKKCYREDNVVLSSHLVAYIAFRYLMHVNKKISLYKIFNLPTEDFVIPKEVFYQLLTIAVEKLKEKEIHEKVRLSEKFQLSIEKLAQDGIKNLGIFHPNKPLVIKENGDIASQDFRLLYFYHNRLEGYNLENFFDLNVAENYVTA
jgi:glycerol-3-phosphate O-acyltransferase